MSSIKPRLPLAVFVLATLCSGCTGDSEAEESEPSPNTWVGTVAETDIAVALVERESTSTVFFCGGESSYETSTRWFNEAVLLTEGFSFTTTGWRVEGAMNDGTAQGVVQPPNATESAWSALPVQEGTLAGLYEGAAPCGKLGLIVTQPTANDEPSGQGTCTRTENELSIVEQVNPVRLERTAEGGILVTVGTSEETFTVLPATSAAR